MSDFKIVKLLDPITVTYTPQNSVTVFNVKDSAYGAIGDGVADDTTAIGAAWTALKAAGGGALFFPLGTYLTKDLLFQSFSNFALIGERGSVIYHTPNSALSPGQGTHDVCIVADCTDFVVDGLTFDGRRDTTNLADQYLQSNAASGQKNVTVTDGTQYFVGEAVTVFGGLTANSGNEKTYNDSNEIITGINGNVLTLTSNLTNSYTATGASGGAWITQYQTGGVVAYSIAGRSLGNEDAQNGLHLMNCQRFSLRNNAAQNVWESPIKMGTGFAPSNVGDACSLGIIFGNMSKHGYDQGISVWNSSYITVFGNKCEDAGWAGISFSHCSDSVGTANICVNNTYSPPFDLNEGTGIAVEGGVRVVVVGNDCSLNNSNGVRLNVSPMFGGAAMNQGVSGSLSSGATTITLTGTGNNGNFVNGSSFTVVDPNNSMNRETIYVTGVSGTTLSISPALRNSYASGPTIYGRYGEDVAIIGNMCSEQSIGAGIHTQQQMNLRIFSNDCSKNGFLNGSFQNIQGCYGIHVYTNCESAVVQANTCSFNSQDGLVVDNYNRAVVLQNNACNNNGIRGTTSSQGIKMYGPLDTTVVSNVCSFNSQNGIYLQNGSLATQHNSVGNNTCMYNNSSGIWLDNGGTTVTVTNNKIAYNLDTGIKVLGYKNSLFQSNTCYNQQGQEGIRFDDSGSDYCIGNRVFDNYLYDDQGSPTQSWALAEDGNTSGTVLRGNVAYGNTNSIQWNLKPSALFVDEVKLISSYSSAQTLGVLDRIVLVTGTTTITLPDATVCADREYTVKNTGTNTVTVATTSSQTIDGALTVVMATQYESVTVKSDGANWQVINQVAVSIL